MTFLPFIRARKYQSYGLSEPWDVRRDEEHLALIEAESHNDPVNSVEPLKETTMAKKKPMKPVKKPGGKGC